jgi:hypothetical protein
MKYEVVTTAIAVWKIVVEADSEEEAKNMVFDGDYDPKYDKVYAYLNEEVHEVNEVK